MRTFDRCNVIKQKTFFFFIQDRKKFSTSVQKTHPKICVYATDTK